MRLTNSWLFKMQEHSLFQQQLLSHHRNPVGFETMLSHAKEAWGHNATCGDEILMQIDIQDEHIEALAFRGDSCAICRASASLLCEQLSGKNKEYFAALFHALKLFFEDETVMPNSSCDLNFASKAQLPEALSPLNPVSRYPIRKQCALLPWQTLSDILYTEEGCTRAG